MASLNHSDFQTPVLLKPLHPYTYDGALPTTCRLLKDSLTHLTFIVNRKWANVSLSIETIMPLDEDAVEEVCMLSNETVSAESDGFPNGLANGTKEKRTPSSKMLLGNYTIIYVISGSVHVSLHSGSQSTRLEQGQTLVCERLDKSLPADIAMSPVHHLVNEGISQGQEVPAQGIL